MPFFEQERLNPLLSEGEVYKNLIPGASIWRIIPFVTGLALEPAAADGAKLT